jgi:outer membrane protein TolC
LIRKPKKGQKGRVQAASALTNEQQAQAILQQRLEQFKQRFGREPGQADRVFFQAPSLDAAVDGISKAMESSEIDPAFVYAFRKTGLIVVSENMAELTGAELQVFQDAADEYRNIKTGEQHAEPQLDHDQ